MILTSLKGTLASVDYTIQTDGATATSRKCQFSQIAQQFSRTLIEDTTLCTANWKTRQAMLKDLETTATGFVAAGVGALVPLPINTATTASEVPLVTVLTYFTGCSVTSSGWTDSDLLTIRNNDMDTRVLRIMNTGTPTIPWVTA